MKAGIKRIEATLHDLGTHQNSEDSSDNSIKQSCSFRISVGVSKSTIDSPAPSQEELETPLEQNTPLSDTCVQTFPAQESGCKVPNLPKLKKPSLSSHRNAANPALAMNLLQEIQEKVTNWHSELHKIVRQIQDIYIEGPIVNGWLESQLTEKPLTNSTPNHNEVEQHINQVEEIYTPQQEISDESPRTGYRLCGLDATGQVWSRPCPPEQVPSVSMAIARYQKLRQLLGRKQYLETRLTQLAETLVILHSHIQCQ
jgi:hypothetical protein